MKLITWNCQGAFRNKVGVILSQLPDILIIQECEHFEKLIFDSTVPKPKDSLWFGDNKHKGIGIFSYSEYSFKLHENYNPEFKTIVPIVVTNKEFDFILFAICANNPQDKNNQYIEQVWKAINYYDKLLDSKHSILIGDFNSNKIWDRKHRIGNHSDVVSFLVEKNIYSTYHRFYNEQQGEESKPTFYLYRHENKPYHIDYCFTSEYFTNRIEYVGLGEYNTWSLYSDHMPLTTVFKK